MRRARRVARALCLACALVSVVGLGSPATAGEYRYWSYWQSGTADGGAGDPAWAYASVGPGGARPADGSVEGWRFLVSEDGQGTPPRRPSDFTSLCRDTPERHGHKRVGVVVDYGVASDAAPGDAPPQPRTGCASVAEDATGSDVLEAVAHVRFDADGFVCAVDAYPSDGCGDQVSGTTRGDGTGRDGDGDSDGARAAGASDDGGAPVGLLVGVGMVVVLGGAAAWRSRGARGR